MEYRCGVEAFKACGGVGEAVIDVRELLGVVRWDQIRDRGLLCTIYLFPEMNAQNGTV